MAIKLTQLMNLLQEEPKKEVMRARWMGPMERFDEIQKAGIGWFMVRWYLARNLFMATTALIFVGYILILLQ
jgi:1,4-dihydroxy-2-naphthoate octaprenyltransferase